MDTSSSVYYFSLACVGVGLAIASLHITLAPVHSLPHGPPQVPLFGNLVSILNLSTAPARTCRDLAQRYGDMATLWLGKQPIILINSHRVAHDLLQRLIVFRYYGQA
jgi:hypothetical protein